MGILSDLLIHEGTMARKVHSQKRHDGGLEAPRNSLELPVGTSYGLYSTRDNILYDDNLANLYCTEAPLKKLIGEEMFKRPDSRQNAPSVVARLMGVDMLPFNSELAPQVADIKGENSAVKSMGKTSLKTGSVGHVLPTANYSHKQEVCFGYYTDRYTEVSGHMKCKPKPREHPQEEELQKFKKEFEAWQAERFKNCSNIVKFRSAPAQLIAQEDLNRDKMVLYASSKRTKTTERLREPSGIAKQVDQHEWLTLESCKDKPLRYSAKGKESLYPSGMPRTDFRATHLSNHEHKHDAVSASSKIVILRPGPDKVEINEHSWNSTPSISEEKGSIEDFLEEVKERLKWELKGKCSERNKTIRGGGVETPYREKPLNPRKIARRIAQEVRDSVSRDFCMTLNRSDSSRSYRSSVQFNGTSSPELINRDTRRFLTERLRNVLDGETHGEVPMVAHHSSKLPMTEYEKGEARQPRDAWSKNKMNYRDCFTGDAENQSRSFRGEPKGVAMHPQDLSPRHLTRSLSAPVSGASFGKLLLDDSHLLTGAHIRRKHEVLEKVSLKIEKQKKDKFNIREKVSTLRYSLTLRGKLFRRRVKSVDGSSLNKNNLQKDTASGATVMMNFFEAQENSTEVPPSPASVCSSVREELWRAADYLSPVTSSGGYHLEDGDISHVFGEINSKLNELRKKLNQLEGAVRDETPNEQQSTKVEVYIQDETEVYVRDLLAAAGLYNGTSSCSLLKWDPLGKPISTYAFEEAEDSYIRNEKDTERSTTDCKEKTDHKIVLDLVKEVLPTILREPAISKYMGKTIGLKHKPPQGRKLLSEVWDIIREYVHPPTDESYFSIENMLARDLYSYPWSGSMDDDAYVLARDIESHILRDMIEEMVMDIRICTHNSEQRI